MQCMGPQGIPVLASAVASVFLPHRDKLASMSYEGMPPALVEFVEGIKAVVEDVHSKAPQIIPP